MATIPKFSGASRRDRTMRETNWQASLTPCASPVISAPHPTDLPGAPMGGSRVPVTVAAVSQEILQDAKPPPAST